MVEALTVALAVFAVLFVGLRSAEWLYHRARRTPDWSPHWGSWLFAVLAGIATFVDQLGR